MSHHLLKVLRFRSQVKILHLFNGDGQDYCATVVNQLQNVTCKVEDVFAKQINDTESNLNLTLAQGIAKGEKMDFLIQKAVELGITHIIPMQTERCVVRLRAEKVAKKN